MDWQLHYFYDLIPIFSPLLNYRDEIIHQLLCLITYLKDVPSLSDLATLALSEVGVGEVYLSYITRSIKILAAHWPPRVHKQPKSSSGGLWSAPIHDELELMRPDDGVNHILEDFDLLASLACLQSSIIRINNHFFLWFHHFWHLPISSSRSSKWSGLGETRMHLWAIPPATESPPPTCSLNAFC